MALLPTPAVYGSIIITFFLLLSPSSPSTLLPPNLSPFLSLPPSLLLIESVDVYIVSIPSHPIIYLLSFSSRTCNPLRLFSGSKFVGVQKQLFSATVLPEHRV